MNLKAWLETGEIPALHPAGMFLLIAFLAISWIFRKTFCSWLCPVGTVSEWLWKLGKQTFGRNFALPRWLDIPLRGLKYILLGLFLYVVVSMPVPAIRAFLEGPYGLVADVKMLNFFRFMGVTVAVSLGVLVILSVFVQNFWCRYLCPYGALLGLVSLASPMRIRRNPETCIDCAKCAKACPSHAPRGQAGHDPLGRVHGLPGLRGGLPGRGRAAPVAAAAAARAGLGRGGRHRRRFPGHLRVGAVDRPLAHGPPQPRLLRAHSPRPRVRPPVARISSAGATLNCFRPHLLLEEERNAEQ